ncbi:unnamed protein product [Arabidopsis arenosa]|uniref:DUF1985 domain-containing protein n=1 Tax=Arabidopsis arenosa TaxID=38785 RepID=A0A8S1ZLX9_ARAAE|nr:unnamed protein product [Arabidopsis arenosa]
MGDSFRTDVTLPKLLYNIGHEPNSDVKINQCARYEYIDEVQCILSATEFQRIRDSFLGPVLKATARGLNFSGKLIHCLLARSLTTVKEKELWFHFGGQPMEFSIREFHMVTGLKCSPQEGDENLEHNRYGWANTKQQHTSDELLEILRNTDRDSVEKILPCYAPVD